MRLFGFVTILTGLLLQAGNAHADTLPLGPQLGDTYQITMVRESTQSKGEGSSGSSYDRDTIIEKVIGVRPDGLELEYDLPRTATKADRASTWQFPVRVFKPTLGSPQLLNRSELETRIDSWLKAAKWTRDVCGRWIFTWNAFRIECDPQSVIETLEAFDLRVPDLRDGALYKDKDALDPAPLKMSASGRNGGAFTAELLVDPEVVRRARADGDVVVGELMKKPTTLAEALQNRAKEAISGTISITLQTDRAGSVWRRTKVTKLETKGADDQLETETRTATTERRLLPDRAARR